jgi:glycosyltransferase involved in cell wall biosynthesis
MSDARWHVVTGEYPPQPGGVSDYTRLLARALAAAGDEVQVWAPAAPGPEPEDPGVSVRRLPGRFDRRSRAELDAGLARARPGFRLLVQYVPHMYGMKGMNLAFAWWLWRRRHLRPWVMFHEVAHPCAWGQPLRHNVLGVVQRVMAGLAARSAARLFVSTPWWAPRLRRLAPASGPATWAPVPSTIADSADSAAVAEVRGKVGCGAGSLLVGHFGSFGDGPVPRLLASVLPPVLRADAGRVGLLIGRGGEAFVERLLDEHPGLAGRLTATGGLAADAAAAHLRACDLLLQPYPDGVSGRRTSLMAGLALGVPLATTHGPATEPVWAGGPVALAPADDPAALVAVAERLLADPGARRRLGEKGRAVYEARFSIDRTVRALREDRQASADAAAAVQAAASCLA